MEAAATNSFCCATSHSSTGEHADARFSQAGLSIGKWEYLLRSNSRRVHCASGVSSNFAKVSSIANKTKGETGSTLLGGKLESTSGTIAVPPLSFGSGNHPDATVAAVDVALLSNMEQEAELKEKWQSAFELIGKGRFVEKKLVYRQTFAIRSYQPVGFDKTASIDTITNLFQETALNHVSMCDFGGHAMGRTHEMMKSGLIWVVTRMLIQVARYPVWSDIVEIDTWVNILGKNGMRRDFLVRDVSSGEILARGTSNWALMNQDTRRLSKMSKALRAEMSPFFLDRYAMEDEYNKKIPTLDDSAPFICSDLVPKLQDTDLNQHVNNVKYINWVMESVPLSLLMAWEVESMMLEYRRECGPNDVVESLTCPLEAPFEQEDDCVSFMHLLRLQRTKNEVLRATTSWRPKSVPNHLPSTISHPSTIYNITPLVVSPH